VSGSFSSTAMVLFSVLTTTFGSTNDLRVGLEDKCMLSRHRQTQVYLDQAQEMHRRIEVRGHRSLSCDARWANDFLSSFGSVSSRACINSVWALVCPTSWTRCNREGLLVATRPRVCVVIEGSRIGICFARRTCTTLYNVLVSVM
jgi:hypothetical protein